MASATTLTSLQSFAKYPFVSASVQSQAGIEMVDIEDECSKASSLNSSKFKRYKAIQAVLARCYKNANLESSSLNVKGEKPSLERLYRVSMKKFNDLVLKPIVKFFSNVDFMPPSEPNSSGCPMLVQFEHYAGAINMFETSFNIIELIPRLYKKTFGEVIKPDTYRSIIENSKNLLDDLSKFYKPVFFGYVKKMIEESRDGVRRTMKKGS